MSDNALMREDVYRQPVDAAQFGVVARIDVAVEVGRVEDRERERVDGKGNRE